MNELIAISGIQFSSGKVQTVDARQLHEFLEVGKDFSTWISDKVICDEFFTEDHDYVLLPKVGEQTGRGGHNRKDYALTLDTGKHVAMMERTAKGKQARQYFIECERELKAQPAPALPQNFAEALRLAADLEEQKVLLEGKIAEDAPHVEFSRAIEDSSGSIEIGEFAKVLKNTGIKIGRNRLYDFLRDESYLMKNNVPYQKYVDNGYFTVEEKTWESKNGPKPYVKTKITGKGQKVIARKVATA